MLLRCVPCKQLFRVSGDDAGHAVNCPHCGELLSIPWEKKDGEQPAALVPAATSAIPPRQSDAKPPPSPQGPRKVRDMPVKAEAPRNIAAKTAGQEFAPLRAPGEAFVIPPSRSKTEYDVAQLIVPNANTVKAPVHEDGAGPRLDHLERLATTQDPRFIPDSNAPEPSRAPLVGRARKQSLVAWDEDAEEDASVPGEAPPPPFRRYLKYIGIATLALVMATLLVNIIRDANGNKNPAGNPASAPAHTMPGPIKDGERNISMIAEKLENQVLPLAKAFLEAKNAEERLRLVRDPERVRPLMEAYDRKRGSDGAIPYEEIGNLSTIAEADVFFLVPVVTEAYGQRKLAIEETADGFLADWESFVIYSDMTFHEFEEQQPTEPKTFRVHAVFADYFNYGFTEAEYACLRLHEPDSDDNLYGYIRRDALASGFGLRLATDLQRQNGVPAYMTLRLRYAPDAKASNQVLIDDYLQLGWIFRSTEQADAAPVTPNALQQEPSLEQP